jgi:hypothetical protein
MVSPVEVDAGPVPGRFEHREPECGLAGAKDTADQAFPVFHMPQPVTASLDVELMRRMMLRKTRLYAVHLLLDVSGQTRGGRAGRALPMRERERPR